MASGEEEEEEEEEEEVLSRGRAATECRDASTPRRVTVANRGQRPLRVAAIRIRGADRAQFRLVAGRDGCSEKTLPPGAMCRFLLRFEPAAAGLRRAIALIPSNDPNEARLQVALRGTGTQAP